MCPPRAVEHVRFFHSSNPVYVTPLETYVARTPARKNGENHFAKWHGHRRRQQRGPADAAGLPDGGPAAASVALRRRLHAQQPPQIAVSYTRAVTTRTYLIWDKCSPRCLGFDTFLHRCSAAHHGADQARDALLTASWSSVTGAHFWASLISAIILGALRRGLLLGRLSASCRISGTQKFMAPVARHLPPHQHCAPSSPMASALRPFFPNVEREHTGMRQFFLSVGGWSRGRSSPPTLLPGYEAGVINPCILRSIVIYLSINQSVYPRTRAPGRRPVTGSQQPRRERERARSGGRFTVYGL